MDQDGLVVIQLPANTELWAQTLNESLMNLKQVMGKTRYFERTDDVFEFLPSYEDLLLKAIADAYHSSYRPTDPECRVASVVNIASLRNQWEIWQPVWANQLHALETGPGYYTYLDQLEEIIDYLLFFVNCFAPNNHEIAKGLIDRAIKKGVSASRLNPPFQTIRRGLLLLANRILEIALNWITNGPYNLDEEGTFKYDDNQYCIFCSKDYTATPEKEIFILPCNHRAHTQCINPWLSSKNRCPHCRVIYDGDVRFNETFPGEECEREQDITEIFRFLPTLQEIEQKACYSNRYRTRKRIVAFQDRTRMRLEWARSHRVWALDLLKLDQYDGLYNYCARLIDLLDEITALHRIITPANVPAFQGRGYAVPVDIFIIKTNLRLVIQRVCDIINDIIAELDIGPPQRWVTILTKATQILDQFKWS